jgi:alkylation response protein AidB-like acyl-CoA dehydrogenase
MPIDLAGPGSGSGGRGSGYVRPLVERSRRVADGSLGPLPLKAKASAEGKRRALHLRLSSHHRFTAGVRRLRPGRSARNCLYVNYNVTKNALDAVSTGMEFSGNPGLPQANPLERHYRDVLCARVHPPGPGEPIVPDELTVVDRALS